MRIGLTYDLQTDAADERQAEFDPPATIAALRGALETLGHHVIPLGSAGDLLQAPQHLRDVDLVLNIAEGSSGRCREAWVPTLLELFSVPYVGSDPLALMLGLDKVMSKRLAQAAGVLTPRWVCVEHSQPLPSELPLRFPVIVKPRSEGSGRGIDAGAVVHTKAALEPRIQWLFERCQQPVVVEEFIGYGELTMWVIGNNPAQAYPAIQRPLDPATRLSYHVVHPAPSTWEAPLVLEASLEAGAQQMALAMFETLGCRDLARIDLRVDENGQLYFLEINPLPSFDPAGGLGLLAECLGITYDDLVGRILDATLIRLRGVGGAHIQPTSLR